MEFGPLAMEIHVHVCDQSKSGLVVLNVSFVAVPNRPREFHPEPLTDPDLILSHHPARAID
jgi:hypothetical protein